MFNLVILQLDMHMNPGTSQREQKAKAIATKKAAQKRKHHRRKREKEEAAADKGAESETAETNPTEEDHQDASLVEKQG